MIQQTRRLLYGPSTRLRLASSGSIITRQVITPSPPCTNLQKAILILWFFVLTAVHMVWTDKAIAADPNVPVFVLKQPDIDGFDRELFTSNGFNTSEIFSVGNYRQANFRLAQRNDPNLTINWDQFVNLVSSVTSTADSIHGIPLLISKIDFTVTLPEIKTFFMAALAAETIFYRDVTIISSPAFHLSADPVERIFLQLEGNTIELDPAGNTPLQFSSAGEKTMRLTVQFRSGFVGANLSRVIVK
jgi:hypothetical protein